MVVSFKEKIILNYIHNIGQFISIKIIQKIFLLSHQVDQKHQLLIYAVICSKKFNQFIK